MKPPPATHNLVSIPTVAETMLTANSHMTTTRLTSNRLMLADWANVNQLALACFRLQRLGEQSARLPLPKQLLI